MIWYWLRHGFGLSDGVAIAFFWLSFDLPALAVPGSSWLAGGVGGSFSCFSFGSWVSCVFPALGFFLLAEAPVAGLGIQEANFFYLSVFVSAIAGFNFGWL